MLTFRAICSIHRRSGDAAVQQKRDRITKQRKQTEDNAKRAAAAAARATFLRCEEPVEVGECTFVSGQAMRLVGRAAEAMSCFQHAGSLFDEAGAAEAYARAQLAIAETLASTGQLEPARAMCESLLNRLSASGNRHGTAGCLRVMAGVLRELGLAPASRQTASRIRCRRRGCARAPRSESLVAS